MVCKICGKEYKNLGNHLRYNHASINSQKYYDTFFKQSNEGICIECGKPTKFMSSPIGYRKFCSVSCSRRNENTQEKYKQTCLERYGEEMPYMFGGTLFKKIIKEKYNVDNVSQLDEVKQHKENTFLEHFGIKNNFGNKLISNKAIQSSQTTEAWIKRRNTYKQNNKLSKLELLFEENCNKLNIQYIPQYKEKRYPYHCDFYLPKYDTFIEINGHWTHNNHIFNSTNINDLLILSDWKEKAKTSKFYKQAVYIWTELDINKQKIAIQNNLNFIILWNKNDIINFFNNLSEII